VKRERTRKTVQIRVIAEDLETVLKVMKLIRENVKFESANITGVFPNRKEVGYRGYMVVEVIINE